MRTTAGAAHTAANSARRAACSFMMASSGSLSRSRSAPGLRWKSFRAEDGRAEDDAGSDMPPGQTTRSHARGSRSATVASARILRPRLIVTSVVSSTDATVTSAPARTSVSWMQLVSISSEPFAMGTSTWSRGASPSELAERTTRRPCARDAAKLPRRPCARDAATTKAMRRIASRNHHKVSFCGKHLMQF